MCGNVGMAGNLFTADEHIMDRMLTFDYWRGKDSTGIAKINTSGKASVAKVASHPMDLFATKAYATVRTPPTARALIGHNRAATLGAVNSLNAHPFQLSDCFVGAHNGTLTSWCKDNLEKIVGREFEVDSEAMLAAIEQEGIKSIIPELEGAWAIVCSDGEKLWMIRNDERDLWVAYSKSLDRLYWASEWSIISAAINITPKTKTELHTTDEGYRFFNLKTDTLYEWDLKELVRGYKAKNFDALDVADKGSLEGKGGTPVYTNHGWSGSYEESRWGEDDDDPFGRIQGATTTKGKNGGKNKSKKTKQGSSDSKKHQNVLNLQGTDEEPYGKWISQEEWLSSTLCRCAWCASDISYYDVGTIVFEREEISMCAKCSGVPESSNTPSNRIVTPLPLEDFTE